MKKNKIVFLALSAFFIINSTFSQSNLNFYSLSRIGFPDINEKILCSDSSVSLLKTKYTFSDWGKRIYNEVIRDSNYIYSTTAEGGASGYGTIFKVNLDDNKYEKLWDLDSTIGYNCPVKLSLVNNKLYGVCYNGGIYNRGTLFMYDLVLDTCITLHDFDSLSSNKPITELLLYNNKFYGATDKGGSDNKGSIYSYDLSSGTINFIKDLTFSNMDFVLSPSGKIYLSSYDLSKDSSYVFEYDIVSNNILKIKSVVNKISPMLFFSGKLYGFFDAFEKRIFSLDPVSLLYTNLLSAANGESVVSRQLTFNPTNNKFIYISGSKFIEYDPITNTCLNDNSIYGYGLGYYTPERICIGLNNKYYISCYGSSPSPYYGNQKGTITEFDRTNHLVKVIVDFDKSPQGYGFQDRNLISISNKLYGCAKGGSLNNSFVLYEYDIATGKHKVKKELGNFSIPYLIQVSNQSFLTLGSNNKIYGMLADNTSFNYKFLIYEYDPQTDSLVCKIVIDGNMPSRLIETTPNVFIYHDYNGLYKYDLSTDTITYKALNLSIGGVLHNIVGFLNSKTVNGKLYGYCSSITYTGSAIFEYDVAGDSISKTAPFNAIFPYFYVTASHFGQISSVYANNGNLYLLFGYDNPSNTNTGCILEYNPHLNTLSLKYTFPIIPYPTTPYPAGAILCQSVNNKIYGKFDERFYEYDIDLNTVTDKYASTIGLNAYLISDLYPVCQNSLSIITQPSSYTTCSLTGSISLSTVVSLPTQTAYQWFFNDEPILGATSSVYSKTFAGITDNGNYYCSVFNGCDRKKTNSTIVSFGPLSINTNTITSICIGTSAYLAATGATTYTWSTGATTSSINISPPASTIYTVIGTDLNNCSTTQTVSVTVDNTCADVWPGDANSDGTADNLDVLELGLHYTQSGAPRTSTSNSWQSYVATNWVGTITSGKNLNHSDCNGDGLIDANDTLAIYLNYGLTHAFKSSQQTSTNEQLTIVPDQPMVNKGQWGTASVYLGSSTSPINTINGLAFTLHFDQSLIEPNSMQIDYPVSFLNTGQNLNFRKQDDANGALYAATTHTNNSNINGYGKIAVIHYQIKSSLVHDTVLAFNLVQATQSSANGSLVPLTSGSTSVTAIGATVGINELSGNNMVAIYPNPANNMLIVTSTTELQKVELLSVTGQVIISEPASGNQHQLDVSSVSNGVYIVAVFGQNHVIQRKKIVIQH